MQIITINLPERYLSAIQTLTDLGIYSSRSEAIRIALRDFLTDELRFYKDLEEEEFMKKQKIQKQKQKQMQNHNRIEVITV